MTIKTDLSKKQLTTILSALDDAPRNPANKGEALRAIGRSAAKLVTHVPMPFSTSRRWRPRWRRPVELVPTAA